MSTWISAKDAFQHVLSIELVEEVARRKIERRIRDGEIPGHADVLDYGDTQGRDMVIPPAFWQHEMSCHIDFEASTVVREKWWQNGNPRRSDEPAKFGYAYSIQGLQLSRQHLFRIWPQSGKIEIKQAQAPTRKGVGGAPTKYSWAEASAYMAHFIVENDYPATKADASRVLSEWFQERNEQPDRRDVEKWIDVLWAAKHG